MKRVFLCVLVLALAGCRGTQPYTARDLASVKRANATIVPIYLDFRTAFRSGDSRGILQHYGEEQQACRQVDVIDRRDTIDPNVNLFLASSALDDYCNAIESAYVFWAKRHHYHYDKSIIPGRPQEVFEGTDLELKKVPKYLRHPAALS